MIKNRSQEPARLNLHLTPRSASVSGNKNNQRRRGAELRVELNLRESSKWVSVQGGLGNWAVTD